MNETIDETRRRRFRFLHSIYERSNGTRGVRVNWLVLGRELGFERADDTLKVLSFLIDENLCEVAFLDCSITHEGIKAVEEAMASPTRGSGLFPAVQEVFRSGDAEVPCFRGETLSAEKGFGGPEPHTRVKGLPSREGVLPPLLYDLTGPEYCIVKAMLASPELVIDGRARIAKVELYRGMSLPQKVIDNAILLLEKRGLLRRRDDDVLFLSEQAPRAIATVEGTPRQGLLRNILTHLAERYVKPSDLIEVYGVNKVLRLDSTMSTALYEVLQGHAMLALEYDPWNNAISGVFMPKEIKVEVDGWQCENANTSPAPPENAPIGGKETTPGSTTYNVMNSGTMQIGVVGSEGKTTGPMTQGTKKGEGVFRRAVRWFKGLSKAAKAATTAVVAAAALLTAILSFGHLKAETKRSDAAAATSTSSSAPATNATSKSP